MTRRRKKQIKADCAELRKLLAKSKPEEMTGGDIVDIRSAMSRWEQFSASAQRMAEQE